MGEGSGESYIFEIISEKIAADKPGKGNALYECKLRNLLRGTVVDKTYRAGQTLESALQTGCLAAHEVISHIGARPQHDLEDLSRQHGLVG